MNNTLKVLFTAAFIAVLSFVSIFHSNAQVFKRPGKGNIEKPWEERVEYTVSSPSVSEQLIQHTGFMVSYNQDLLIPNWVAWELTPDEAKAKDVARPDTFIPDPKVKGATAQDSDYRGSGYDRGHMIPAADLKWTERGMAESFYFSNICPQLKALNEGPWLDLEQRCRWWAQKYKTPVYIVCGPIFIGDEADVIGRNEVAVPDAFFKCVAQEREGRWVVGMFLFVNIKGGEHAITAPEDMLFPLNVVKELTGHRVFLGLPEQARASFLFVDKNDWVIPGWKKK